MTSTQINQGNYTVYQPYMLLNFDYSFQNDVLDDDLSVTILEVLGRINLNKFIDFHNLDSRSYDPVMMLTIILMAFAEDGYASLRKLEKLCRYDIRYRSITNGCVPSYKSFERFINHTLKESIQTIAKEIYLYVQDEKALEEQILYIDGTKFEANANKMTFCWKGWSKRYLPRHWQKCMELLKQVNRYFKKHEININYSILKYPNIEYMIKIDEALENWLKEKEYIRKGRGKHEIAKLCDELKKSAVKMWEYAIQEDILEDRNSFSKTDPDATFMHMKYDYYNHTNVFKPGYNVQIGVNNGYIAYQYLSSDPNDIKTLQPFTEGYKELYGKYPDIEVTDAGYGSYDNYCYCKSKGIKGLLKYSGYEKKKEKVNDKNRYQLRHMERQEDGTPVCPAGHVFEIERIGLNIKGQYPKTTMYYRNKNCGECPHRSKCTTSKNGRSARIVPALEKMHKEIDECLKSEEGKRLMRNRSAQAEGAFADIKQDFEYVRLHRRGESGVKVELSLVCIGYNIRNYHNYKIRDKKREKQRNVSKLN